MNGLNSGEPSSLSEMDRCPSMSLMLNFEFLAAILIPSAMHRLRACVYKMGFNFELCYLLFTFSEAVLVDVYSSVLA